MSRAFRPTSWNSPQLLPSASDLAGDDFLNVRTTAACEVLRRRSYPHLPSPNRLTTATAQTQKAHPSPAPHPSPASGTLRSKTIWCAVVASRVRTAVRAQGRSLGARKQKVALAEQRGQNARRVGARQREPRACATGDKSWDGAQLRKGAEESGRGAAVLGRHYACAACMPSALPHSLMPRAHGDRPNFECPQRRASTPGWSGINGGDHTPRSIKLAAHLTARDLVNAPNSIDSSHVRRER